MIVDRVAAVQLLSNFEGLRIEVFAWAQVTLITGYVSKAGFV
jgi:hypothetical protein